MRVIYVDDEELALENFKLTVREFNDIDELQLFSDCEEALSWAEDHAVDVAFLDMEMPECHGIEFAKQLHDINPDISIVFVTAYSNYALDAFGVNAIGYVLKPYSKQEIRNELNKVKRYQPTAAKHIVIQTMPDFLVLVNNKPMHFRRKKAEELFALLVDRAGKVISSSEAITFMWPERPSDWNTQALFRMTLKRLMDALEEEEIDYIIATRGRGKYILTDKVECDLYKMLAGDQDIINEYHGEYLREYSWAEERNAQLVNIVKAAKKNR